jgi:putative redox protein
MSSSLGGGKEEHLVESTLTWKKGLAFDAEIEGFRLTVDGSPETGGQDYGPRPKGLVLTSLAGCTAMDVISILEKMRQEVTTFEVSAEGAVATEHPKRFERITVRYRLQGPGLEPEKAIRAVRLSEERYCAVSAMLRPGVVLESEVWVNGARVA